MRAIDRGPKRKAAAHLFLSHSSKDKHVARQISIDLALCGVDVWLDEWEIRLGQSLPDILADAMAKSRYIGILMTDNYNTSVWTKTEYKRALTREQKEGRIVMLPLLVSGDAIPDFIQDKVYLDLRERYCAGIARLVAVIHDASEFRITRAINSAPPNCIADVWEVLEKAGIEPYALMQREDFDEILKSGGKLLRHDYATFDVAKVLKDPRVSDHSKELIRRLVERPDAAIARADKRSVSIRVKGARGPSDAALLA